MAHVASGFRAGVYSDPAWAGMFNPKAIRHCPKEWGREWPPDAAPATVSQGAKREGSRGVDDLVLVPSLAQCPPGSGWAKFGDSRISGSTASGG